jgi:hypothetical protein
MPVKPSIVGVTDIEQAAGGNPALRAILQQLATAANTQATKTNTSGKGAPNQSTATVSFQNPLYIVTLTDPGGASAASLTQAAQQAAAASLGANTVQAVVYHQVQAATSVLFDAAASLSTYGGNTGSLQTQFVIDDLSTTKAWFFRFRTSFDGSTWNQWKIISKSATAVNPNAVTLEPIAGGQFAGITLIGGQQVGFGIGALPSGGQIQTADGVLLANLLGIAAPAGYIDGGFEAVGLTACSISSLGQITLNYADFGSDRWLGTANFLTFGWAIGAQGIAVQTLGDSGRWVVLTLAGGSRIAIGSGLIASGSTFDVPTGFTAAASMGVCGPAVVGMTTHPAYGVEQATVVSGLCTVTFADNSGHSWPSSANWFAFAWEPALAGNLVTVTGGQFLKIPTPSGNVMLGVGQTESGGIMPLPTGYTWPKCLAFSTPATFDNMLSFAMHGVEVCAIDAGLQTSIGTVTCLYGTIEGPRTGAAAWLAVAWE